MRKPIVDLAFGTCLMQTAEPRLHTKMQRNKQGPKPTGKTAPEMLRQIPLAAIAEASGTYRYTSIM
jgi:hypothetical protein